MQDYNLNPILLCNLDSFFFPLWSTGTNSFRGTQYKTGHTYFHLWMEVITLLKQHIFQNYNQLHHRAHNVITLCHVALIEVQ